MFKHKDNKIAYICLQVKICRDYVRQYWCPTESTSLDEEPPIGLARWQAPYFMLKGNLQWHQINIYRINM